MKPLPTLPSQTSETGLVVVVPGVAAVPRLSLGLGAGVGGALAAAADGADALARSNAVVVVVIAAAGVAAGKRDLAGRAGRDVAAAVLIRAAARPEGGTVAGRAPAVEAAAGAGIGVRDARRRGSADAGAADGALSISVLVLAAAAELGEALLDVDADAGGEVHLARALGAHEKIGPGTRADDEGNRLASAEVKLALVVSSRVLDVLAAAVGLGEGLLGAGRPAASLEGGQSWPEIILQGV